MSLTLLQGYSSAEEEAEEDPQIHLQNFSDGDNDDDETSVPATYASHSSVFNLPKPSISSGLPSALDAFSQVSGPPSFLNNSVEEFASKGDQQQGMLGRRGSNRERKDLPAGAVVEAKPQLVGIHERVRSDIESKQPPTSSTSGAEGEDKRIAGATNPNAEDAAELLRMCVQCGIPKTYSSARGMVCPVCGDRPPADASNKKKGSTVKDKEKLKRMKGQSSHASWKSETEMQLRQHFD